MKYSKTRQATSLTVLMIRALWLGNTCTSAFELEAYPFEET